MNVISTLRRLLLVFLLCGTVRSQAVEAPFVVTIAVLESNGELAHRSDASHFHVLIENTSSVPQRIWRWSNSWGWVTPTFELSDPSGKRWFAGRRKDMRWSRNGPVFETVKPGEIAVIDVYFGDSNTWEGFPLQEGQHKKVQMKAVFEVRETPESKEYEVWTGRVESKPVDVTFVRWK